MNDPRMKVHERMESIRRELASVVRDLGLPVGARNGNGTQLTVVARDGVTEGADNNHVRTLEQLSLRELAGLAEEGLRGAALAAAQRSASPAWTELDGVAVRALLAQVAASNEAGDYRRIDQILERFEDKARQEGTILGRVVRHSAMDGEAVYLVTRMSQDFVKLMHLDFADGYRVPGWTDEPVIPRQQIEDIVSMRDAFAAARERQSSKAGVRP